MSDSLQPHGLQYTRFPCPSLSSEFGQIHVCWVGDTIKPSPPLSPSSPAFNLSLPARGSFPKSRLFAAGGQSTGASASAISSSNEYSGWISFRIDWFDLFVVQGIVKSLHQHHSSKPSVLPCSAFFIVQLSHLYMTTRKTIALTIRAFVDKVMSLQM